MTDLEDKAQWLRADSGSSVLLYTLKQIGWRKGQPEMCNDLMIRIENANRSNNDLNPIAERVLATLNLTEDERGARICEALLRRGVSPEKWPDYFRVRALGDALLEKAGS